jgi:hypothetical protein
MRAQLRLLEYLVHMWDVNEQAFRVGVHTLTIDIEDIYFLIGLSRVVHGYRSQATGVGVNLWITMFATIVCQVPKNTVAR